MCYGKPYEMLASILLARSLVANKHGYTWLDDFERFCAYSGCDSGNAWAKLAYVSADKLEPANEFRAE